MSEFDINSSLDFIRSIQEVNINSTHAITTCPYCSDSSKSHNHLYILLGNGLFYCFLCVESGNILKLLKTFGCDDENLINYVKQFCNFNSTKLVYKPKSFINQYKTCWDMNISFMKLYPEKYTIFKNYLISRIGEVEYTKFLITPGIDDTIQFHNYDGLLSTTRSIDSKFYKNNGELYYFQNSDGDIRSIVFVEGPFDAINMYLYGQFKNAIFIAICGRNFSKKIEEFILDRCVLGKFEFNIIYDNDFIIPIKKYLKYYNPEITFNCWKPIIKKDVGENVEIEKIYNF